MKEVVKIMISSQNILYKPKETQMTKKYNESDFVDAGPTGSDVKWYNATKLNDLLKASGGEECTPVIGELVKVIPSNENEYNKESYVFEDGEGSKIGLNSIGNLEYQIKKHKVEELNKDKKEAEKVSYKEIPAKELVGTVCLVKFLGKKEADTKYGKKPTNTFNVKILPN